MTETSSSDRDANAAALTAGYVQEELIAELEALPPTQRGRDSLLRRVRAGEFCLGTGVAMPNTVLAEELRRMGLTAMARRASENHYNRNCAGAQAQREALIRAAYAQLMGGAQVPPARVITAEQLQRIQTQPLRSVDILSREGQEFLDRLVDDRAVDAAVLHDEEQAAANVASSWRRAAAADGQVQEIRVHPVKTVLSSANDVDDTGSSGERK